MRLQFYAYRDAMSAPPRLLMTGEMSDVYASIGLILWHLNFGAALIKTYKCGHCGDKVPAFCRCPRCEEVALDTSKNALEAF